MKYTVKSGDTIYDAAYNMAGSLGAVDAIMEINGITDYAATLTPGTVLEYDGEILNNAATLKANVVPFNSTYIPEDTLNSMINDLVSIINIEAILTYSLHGDVEATISEAYPIGASAIVKSPQELGLVTSSYYIFDGWMLNGQLMPIGSEIVVDSDITLTGKITEILDRSLTYILPEATPEEVVRIYTKGETATVETPEQLGMDYGAPENIFNGWMLNGQPAPETLEMDTDRILEGSSSIHPLRPNLLRNSLRPALSTDPASTDFVSASVGSPSILIVDEGDFSSITCPTTNPGPYLVGLSFHLKPKPLTNRSLILSGICKNLGSGASIRALTVTGAPIPNSLWDNAYLEDVLQSSKTILNIPSIGDEWKYFEIHITTNDALAETLTVNLLQCAVAYLKFEDVTDSTDEHRATAWRPHIDD